MKKSYLILIILLVTSIWLSSAQSEKKILYKKLYNSIKSTQDFIEPQWKMNFYFQDGTGAKDTLSIGYDSSANQYSSQIDPQFDEGWQQIDTTQFNVYIYKYAETGSGMYPTYPPIDIDIVRKTSISSWPFPNMEFGWVHGELPVVMTWDIEQLDSPDLPYYFEDLAVPQPRAVIEMWSETSFGDDLEPMCINIVNDFDPPIPTVLLTNYPTIDNPYTNINGICMFSDAMWWWSQENTEIGYYFSDLPLIIVVPYGEHFTVYDTKNNVLDDLELFPKPKNNIIKLKDAIATDSFTVYSLRGKELFKGYGNTIDISALKKGTYVVQTAKQTYKTFKR